MRLLLIVVALFLVTGCSTQFDQIGRSVDKNARTLDVIQTEQ